MRSRSLKKAYINAKKNQRHQRWEPVVPVIEPLSFPNFSFIPCFDPFPLLPLAQVITFHTFVYPLFVEPEATFILHPHPTGGDLSPPPPRPPPRLPRPKHKPIACDTVIRSKNVRLTSSFWWDTAHPSCNWPNTSHAATRLAQAIFMPGR